MLQKEKVAKEEQNEILQVEINKFKDYPQLSQFKIEALELSKLLSQQFDDLCQKILQAEPLCEITSYLIDKAVNTRLEFESADEKISEFIT